MSHKFKKIKTFWSTRSYWMLHFIITFFDEISSFMILRKKYENVISIVRAYINDDSNNWYNVFRNFKNKNWHNCKTNAHIDVTYDVFRFQKYTMSFILFNFELWKNAFFFVRIIYANLRENTSHWKLKFIFMSNNQN